MMTDGVGRRSATLSVQGQVRKSNGRRRRQRYQCRGRWFETPQLDQDHPSAPSESPWKRWWVTRFQNPTTRRDRPHGSYVSRSLASEAEATGSNPVGRANKISNLARKFLAVLLPSKHIANRKCDWALPLRGDAGSALGSGGASIRPVRRRARGLSSAQS